jgi:hypothetical protein
MTRSDFHGDCSRDVLGGAALTPRVDRGDVIVVNELEAWINGQYLGQRQGRV